MSEFDIGAETRRAYDEVAERYAAHADASLHNEFYERPALRALLPSVEGKRVLDAGCAAGAHTRWLLDQGAEVVGIDLSPSMLDLARQEIGDEADLRVHDLRTPLNFLATDSIDLIVSSLVLEYLEDLVAPFGEFRRVIRSRGSFVFSVHHPFSDWRWFGLPDYYARATGTDYWSGVGREMPWVRRTLQDYFDALATAGWMVRRLEEPVPDPALRERFPESFQAIEARGGGPVFLFVEAVPGE